jgi:transcription initiation factor TFIIE subunit alpha
MVMKLRIDNPLVVEFISTNAGDAAFSLVKTLDKVEKGMTDEQITKKTKTDVNEVRAILNKLHYLGIITYSKKKAKESNWYHYTWFLKKDRIKELLTERYKDELEQMEKKLKYEQSYTFFKCTNGCDKLPFELACEYDFKCPECGNAMDALERNGERENIEKRMGEIRKFLE